MSGITEESDISPAQSRSRVARSLLERAYAQHGMALMVDGLAGMGKTYFLKRIVDLARADGRWAVSYVTADRVEENEPYSFIERILATGIAPDWDFAPDAATQPVVVARTLVKELAGNPGESGRILAIDDAQWIDPESVRVLRYLIPRVIRRGVMIACGVRAPHAPDSFGEVLASMIQHSDPDVIHHILPLTVDEIRAFSFTRFSGGISVNDARRLRNLTGGSFLNVDTILAHVTPEEASQLHLSWSLPIRGATTQNNPLLQVFNNVDARTRATVEIICLADHEITRVELANATRMLDEDLALDEAIAAGMVTESGFGATIIPRHALMAHAVRDTVEPERRRRVSRALAEITTGYRSVRHALGAAETWDERLHEQVRAYVDDALRQGGYSNASDILRTALTLVTDHPARKDILVTLALVHLRAKTGYAVLDLLDEYEGLDPSVLREFIAIMISAHRPEIAFPHERVQRLLAVPSTDPDERTIQAFLAFMMVIMTMRSPDPLPVPQLIGHAKMLFADAPAADAELSDPRLAWMVAPEEYGVLLDCYLMVHSQRTLDFASVRRDLPSLTERTMALPDCSIKVDCLVALAGALAAIGHIEDAARTAQTAVSMRDRVEDPWAGGTVPLILADNLIVLGEYREAAALIELSEEIAYSVLDIETRPALAALRMFLAAVTGSEDPESLRERAEVQFRINWEGYGADLAVLAACEAAWAREDARGVLAVSEGAHVEHIVNTRRSFLTYRAHALLSLGRLDEADALIGQLEEWRGTLWHEHWGTLTWLHARQSHARGDHARAQRLYEQAIASEEFPLPRARATVDYGDLLVERGSLREAGEHWSTALVQLEDIGAHALTARVRARLESLDSERHAAQRKLVGSLTAREREIAGFLAEGRSNQQIADELVVSVATVRFHVSNILRKLHVASRAGVAHALGEGS